MNSTDTGTDTLPSSFKRLNLAQALGALNDNVIKLIIVFFLISHFGRERAATVAAIGSAAFVAPFLFFRPWPVLLPTGSPRDGSSSG